MPPPGVFVNSLPKGAIAESANGNRYFKYGGVWYKPYYSGSDVTYETVSNPTA
jgi:hypothetical protein